MAKKFAKVKEFLEAGEFTFGSTGNNGVVTPTKKVALSTWTNYYKSLVMKPSHTIQKLYPVLDQCKALDTETLKTERSHLIRQLHGLKLQNDTEIKVLIERLSSVSQDVLLRGFGENPNQHQERRVNTYFMELQVEVSIKIGKLTDIDEGIGKRYASIMQKVDFADLPILTTRSNQPTTAQPSRNEYSPNPTFLEQGGNKDRTKP